MTSSRRQYYGRYEQNYSVHWRRHILDKLWLYLMHSKLWKLKTNIVAASQEDQHQCMFCSLGSSVVSPTTCLLFYKLFTAWLSNLTNETTVMQSNWRLNALIYGQSHYLVETILLHSVPSMAFALNCFNKICVINILCFKNVSKAILTCYVQNLWNTYNSHLFKIKQYGALQKIKLVYGPDKKIQW